MSDIEREVEKKKQEQAAQEKTRAAMKHESHQAAERDSRLKHYVEKEKAELKREAKEAEVNKDLRQDNS